MAEPTHNPALVETPQSGTPAIPSTSLANPSDQGDPFLTPEENQGGSAAGVQNTPATPDQNAPGQTDPQNPQTPAENGDQPVRIENPTLEQLLAADPSQIEESDRKILEENKDKLTPEQAEKFGITLEPKLLAEKFKTEQDLRAAYASLGGDPNKFTDVKQLEEAYMVRQGEFTRSRQELSERNRVEQLPQTPKVEDITERVVSMMDFSKINDAKDLAAQLVAALVQSIPGGNKPMSEAELAEKLMPKIQEREAKMKELTDLENEVPRLKLVTDANGVAIPNPFRDAFAVYVQGLKTQGIFKGMKTAMKDFIQVGAPTAAAIQDQHKVELQKKQAGQQPPEGGEAIPGNKTPEDDILGGIISAHQEHKGKFGY